MAQKSLFRRQAVDRTLAPDELDRLMRVVDPKGWLALVALVALVVPVAAWACFGSIPTQVTSSDGLILHRGALHAAVSQVSGIVTEVTVRTGDTVRAGQVVVRVRTDSGALAEVDTLFGGRVADVPIQVGMLLDRGKQVAFVEQGDQPLQAVFYIAAEDGKQLDAGMRVHISPVTIKAERYGYLQGTIESVSQLPVTDGDMLTLLQDPSLVAALRKGNNQLEVVVTLTVDSSTPTGFKWSTSRGPLTPLIHGTPSTAAFVLGEQPPIDLIRP